MSNNKPIPLVSVGVPVYNGAKVLRRALDSILSQDYSRVEIIVSDNASTDETEELCKEFSAKDNRITYYRSEKNMGVVWNFNSLIQFSKGKYFMWLSCDDFCAPDYLSKCVALLEANPNPTRAEARVAMSGNLCRCGAYDHYLNGVMRAAGESQNG